MIKEFDKVKAKNKANDLLTKYMVEEPVVDVFNIARKEGLKIKFIEMPEKYSDVAGFLKDHTIYVNNFDPPYRQTFTVAHELGHHVLGHVNRDVLYRRTNFVNEVKSPTEKEADYFAARLLVPNRMLKEAMKKFNLTKDDESYLSSLFGVSKEMMHYRLMDL